MSSQPVVNMRKCGIVVDFGLADGSAFPACVRDALCHQLTYEYREFLRGNDMYRADGSRSRVRLETRRLYDFNGTRIMTGFGFTPRIASTLTSFGYQITYEDMYGHRERVNCFNANTSFFNNLTWRPRQQECLERIIASPGGLISAPPAFGKSEIIPRLVRAYPEAKFAIATKRRDVARTLHRRFLKYMSGVGFVGDGDNTKGRVTIYVAKSLHKADPDVDFFLGDEVHELASDSFCEVIVRSFQHARCFGFSATWDSRADGTSKRLEYIFGPVIFEMSWQEATQLGLVVPVEVRWLNVHMNNNPCAKYSSDVAKKRHGIWCNSKRNKLFADAAQSFADDDQVLILVETVEHAVMLKQYLPEFELCYGDMELDDLHTYQAKGLLPTDYEPMTAEKREVLRRRFEDKDIKKVIATDVWSTGVSFEQLAVLLRADARSSEILDDQAPGRVVRTHADSGKSKGIIYDGYDAFDTGFKRKANERMKRYKEKGWTQIRDYVLE